MNVVSVEGGETIRATNPTVLFTGPYRSSAIAQLRAPSWDVSEDGQRFLMIKEPEGAAGEGAPIILVQDWIEHVRNLFPTSQ